jgi:CheY-like chemotaxis protein
MLEKVKILLAEDDLKTAALIYELLSANSIYDIKWVENGSLAVEAALKEKYDIIFMDIQMPVMDGIEAVKTLRGAGYQGLIVALTAYFEKEKCLAAGMDDYIQKPFSIKDFIKKMNELNYKKGASEELRPDAQLKKNKAIDLENFFK